MPNHNRYRGCKDKSSMKSIEIAIACINHCLQVSNVAKIKAQ